MFGHVIRFEGNIRNKDIIVGATRGTGRRGRRRVTKDIRTDWIDCHCDYRKNKKQEHIEEI